MCNSVSEAQHKRFTGGFVADLLRVLVLLGSLLAVNACQSVAPVVKIGLVAPFEGRYRNVGYDVIYSARLAVREINEAGGIGGTRVALVALDDTGNPEYAEATARSLGIDPAVVAVVGHWLPETSDAARLIYAQDKVPFLLGGVEPFAATDPGHLPADFVSSYATVTPFDEMPGPYAAPAYDAFQLLFQAFVIAQEKDGVIDRSSVQAALDDLK
jgi:ABC-type branched-subunit amino acid transport system substrate-binding protein